MKFFLKVLGLGFTVIVLVLLTLFIRPQIILNAPVASFVLDRVTPIKHWSWKKASFDHQWESWNERTLTMNLDQFCFEFESSSLLMNSCFPRIEYKINLNWSPRNGLTSSKDSFVNLISSYSEIKVLESKNTSTKPTETSIDPFGYYKVLWNDLWPLINIKMSNIEIDLKKNVLKTDFLLKKDDQRLEAQAFDFQFTAHPEKFELLASPDLKVPLSFEGMKAISLKEAMLQGEISKQGLVINSDLKFAGVHGRFESFIKFPINNNDFLKDFLISSKVDVHVEDVEQTLSKIIKGPYDTLPAPLNAMKGVVDLTIMARDANNHSVELFGDLDVDFSGENQDLDFTVRPKALFNIKQFNASAFYVDLNLHKILLQLPRLPKTSLPPQLTPDSRIYKEELRFKKELAQRQQEETPIDLEMVIKAQGANALNFDSNLIDERLKLNLDIHIKNMVVSEGRISLLPMSTTIFKRNIKVESLEIVLNKDQEPQIEAIIKFILPEYVITMDLEGPTGSPRYALSSKPALPQSDILAVLLFGRPMSELEGGDQDAAARTNQLLSQGILSLSVLYFFAGSPIEAIIYDPDNKEVEAQVGLSSKTSLNIGGRSEGMSSLGIRYSLGGGWFIDTSAREHEDVGTSNERDYGVLLERILSY